MLVWLLVQPWARWPGVFPDVSHRLTLVVCAACAGLVRCLREFPVSWQAVVLLAMAVLGYHAWPLVREASYFESFTETAALSDGLLVVFAYAWGVWSLTQVPVRWMRRVLWGGLVVCSTNVLVVAWQLATQTDSVGLMGLSRCLGATAVAWTPILMTWSPWCIMGTLWLVFFAGTHVAWAGVPIAVGFLKPRWLWWLVPVSLCGILVWSHGAQNLITSPDYARFSKLNQRLQTWGPVLRATTEHPWIGWGFGPMAYSRAGQAYGARLPSVHSDWLALALFGGWPLCVATLWAWGQVLWTAPRTKWMAALRASLAAIGVMAMVQGVVSHARVGGLVLVLLAWWLVESRQAKECLT